MLKSVARHFVEIVFCALQTKVAKETLEAVHSTGLAKAMTLLVDIHHRYEASL